eukprot:GHVQ01032733.1.p1 GENE.GHVQ01032733.1~~GHVQ01032733.1.p1  ORF type:complete len:1178 (+),score=163.68 GHVQ01032733.1:285-3818(+)
MGKHKSKRALLRPSQKLFGGNGSRSGRRTKLLSGKQFPSFGVSKIESRTSTGPKSLISRIDGHSRGTVQANPFDICGNKRRKCEVLSGNPRANGDHSGDIRRRRSQMRNANLLKEVMEEDRSHKFNDMRWSGIGKSRPEAAFSRGTKRKANPFVLSDDEEELTPHDGVLEEDEALVLSHGGKPLDKITDSEIIKLGRQTTTEEYERRQTRGTESDDEVDGTLVSELHFKGVSEDSTQVKKSRKEVLREIIAKSKTAKHERSLEKEFMDELLEKLDEGFGNVTSELSYRPDKLHYPEKTVGQEEPDNYDVLTKDLKFGPRSMATDRLKTPQELAKEKADRLERLEALRLQRTQDHDGSDCELRQDEVGLGSFQRDAASVIDEDSVNSDENEETDAEDSCDEEQSEVSIEAEDRESESGVVTTMLDSGDSTDDADDLLTQRQRLHSGHSSMGVGKEESGGGHTNGITDGNGNTDSVAESLQDRAGDSVEVECGRKEGCTTEIEGRASDLTATDECGSPALEEQLADWMVNDKADDAQGLPYKVDKCPATGTEVRKLMFRFSPKSQYKLVQRILTTHDRNLCSGSKQTRDSFFHGLLTYVLQELSLSIAKSLTDSLQLRKQEETLTMNKNKTDKYVEEEKASQCLHVLLKAACDTQDTSCINAGRGWLVWAYLQESIIDLLQEFPETATQLFLPCVRHMAARATPTLEGSDLWQSSSTTPLSAEVQALLKMSKTIVYHPCPFSLAVAHLVVSCFPRTDFRHPLMTPVSLLLDYWACGLSDMRRHRFLPMSPSTAISTGSDQQSDDSSKLLFDNCERTSTDGSACPSYSLNPSSESFNSNLWFFQCAHVLALQTMLKSDAPEKYIPSMYSLFAAVINVIACQVGSRRQQLLTRPANDTAGCLDSCAAQVHRLNRRAPPEVSEMRLTGDASQSETSLVLESLSMTGDRMAKLLAADLLQLTTVHDSGYVPCIHFVVPAVSALLRELKPFLASKSESASSLIGFVGENALKGLGSLSASLQGILQLCQTMCDKDLTPLTILYSKPQGIVMLTPKYVNPRDPRGRILLKVRGDVKAAEMRKLKNDVNDARRHAARALKRDAEFVAAVDEQRRIVKNAKLESNTRRLKTILQEDQAEYKKMKTTGGNNVLDLFWKLCWMYAFTICRWSTGHISQAFQEQKKGKTT